MDDLQVEKYCTEKAVTKKRSISARVTATGSAIALTLGLFGLTVLPGSCSESDSRDPHEQEERHPMPVGGAGAWFVSILEDM